MKQTTRAFLTGIIGVLGTAVFVGLTVYPFHYGFVESALLAGAFVFLALFETVLDRSTL
ncbi:hypothetical protein [Halomicrococcus sp. SG-WS-1]|uniref:hypothetical protein n=1 Tax=Halomicrococcus sp. SG-WS-1 TaxID=3439057 RepID=UPI003F793B9E